MAHTFSADELRRSAESRLAQSAARFWDRIDRSGGPEACWPWMGAKRTLSRYGAGAYGIFRRRGHVVYAHREALERSLGRPLAAGEIAMHHCDNPPCCNPAHLSAGTKADNSADMARKGRSTAGLTVEQVVEIKRALAGGQSKRSLGREYGVSQFAIQSIGRGRTYRYIEGAA